MNNRLRLLLILTFAILWISSTAIADTKISVTGTGETQVSADTAVISLGVSAQDKVVLTAQKKVNETVAAIRKALIDKGVSEECINTDYMNIYAVYDYSNEQEQLTAYNASSTLAIKVTDMDSVGTMIDAAFSAGANTLNGITFSASNTEEAKSESLKKAVADAKAKAETLAEASSLKISSMDNISEGGVYSYDNTVGNFLATGARAEDVDDAGTVVQAAKLVVSATVNASFSAE